jgi:hypothetical protein
MGVSPARYVRGALTPEETLEMERVDRLAADLASHLQSRARSIGLAHVHNAQSSAIQVIVSDLLRAHLGFQEERILTRDLGFISGARPDFYFGLGPGRGILAEVERGGAVANNHDLKDLWKAHIAPDAQHLFLVVPYANWKADGQPRERPFQRVNHRLGTFFGDPRREIDVVSLHVFGYGDEVHSA